MRPEFVNFYVPAVPMSEEFLMDTDILTLSTFFIFEKDVVKRIEWLGQYSTCDRQEAQRRCLMTLQFLKEPNSLTLFRQLISLSKDMSELYNAFMYNEGKLLRCVRAYWLMSKFITSVDLLCQGLLSYEDKEIKQLYQYAWETQSSPLYKLVKERILSFEDWLHFPIEFDLYTNVTRNGDAISFYEEILSEHEQSVSIFKTYEIPNGLFGSIPMKRGGETPHLEAFFIKKLETKWRGNLSKAEAELKKVDFQAILDWCSFLKQAEYFVSALLYAGSLNAKACPLCVPALGESGITAKSLYYPNMLLSVEGKLPIPQSFEIQDEDTVVITGPNSSGKTSVLKSIAQSCFLAHLGFPIPAEHFSCGVYHGYLSLFSAGEDTNLQQSRFDIEAAALGTILQKASPGTFVAINEPFTSTNSAEAAQLLVKACSLLTQKRIYPLMVTHIYDFFHMAKKINMTVQSFIMESTSDNGEVHYSYKLTKKAPDVRSYATMIAKQHGLDITKLLKDKDKLAEVEAYLEKEGL